MGKVNQTRKKTQRVVHTEMPCDQWISRRQSPVKHGGVSKMRRLLGAGRVKNPLIEMEFLSQPVEITATRQTSLTAYFNKPHVPEKVHQHQFDTNMNSDLQSSDDSDLPHVLSLTNHSPEKQVIPGSANQDVRNTVKDDTIPDWSCPSPGHLDSADILQEDMIYTEPRRKVKTSPKYPENKRKLASKPTKGKENQNVGINKSEHPQRLCTKRKHSSNVESDAYPPHRSCTNNRNHSRSPKYADRNLEEQQSLNDGALCLLDGNSPLYKHCDRRSGTVRNVSNREQNNSHTKPECDSDNVELISSDHEIVVLSDSQSSQHSKGKQRNQNQMQYGQPQSSALNNRVFSVSSQDSLRSSRPLSDSHEYSYTDTEYTPTTTQKLSLLTTKVNKAVQQFALDLQFEEKRLLDKRKSDDNVNDSETQPMTFNIPEQSCDARSHDEESCDLPLTFHVSSDKLCDPDSSSDFHQSQVSDQDSQLSDDSQFSPLTFH